MSPSSPNPTVATAAGRMLSQADVEERPWVARKTAGEPKKDTGPEAAFQVLKRWPLWWQQGGTVWAARTTEGAKVAFISVYFRIRILTSHEAA